jgi:SnoaL-like protein
MYAEARGYTVPAAITLMGEDKMTSEMTVDPGLAPKDLVGPAFAQALAARDFDKLRALLDPAVEFRALTPRRAWEADGDAETLALFQRWFDLPTVVDEIDDVSSDSVGDRGHLSYRFLGHGDDGPFVIEQQVYFTERDGRIDWMRMMCSGFRPR